MSTDDATPPIGHNRRFESEEERTAMIEQVAVDLCSVGTIADGTRPAITGSGSFANWRPLRWTACGDTAARGIDRVGAVQSAAYATFVIG